MKDIGVPDCDVDVLLSEDLGDSKMRKAYELFQENLKAMGMRSDHGRRVVLTSNDLVAQGCMAWLWGRSEKCVPVPGFRTEKQVEDNARAMEFGPLTPAQMQEIDRILKAQD